MTSPKVALIMGSDSDWPVMKDAADVLESFDVVVEKDIVSAHRTPDKMATFAKDAKDRGISVIIAGAGGAAHLPGMVASMTTVPVIGVADFHSLIHKNTLFIEATGLASSDVSSLDCKKMQLDTRDHQLNFVHNIRLYQTISWLYHSQD